MTEADFIPYACQSISEDDIQAVSNALRSPFITRGPAVEAFEADVAAYCGVSHAVLYSNGSAALAGACFAAGAQPGDEIVTSANTFIASLACGTRFGATPRMVDIDTATGNLNLDALEQLAEQPLSRGKRIIVPVHFAGVPVDMQRISSMRLGINDVVIEDAAHALGSRYRDGNPVGSCCYSDMTVFSFHPAKTITSGEGGMVMTNSDDLAHRLRLFRNNGIERDPAFMQQPATAWGYEVQMLGCNYNVTEMQAALGHSQFQRLDAFSARRRQLLSLYQQLLADLPGVWLQAREPDERVAYHLCVATIDFDGLGVSRQELMEQLRAAGVGTQVHYIPLYRHPAVQALVGDVAEQFPEMEKYYSRALTLPLYPDMRDQDVHRVCAQLKNCLAVRQ